jgi:hypothetical protein
MPYEEWEIQSGNEAEEMEFSKIAKFMNNYQIMKKEYDRMEKYIIKNNIELAIYYAIPKVNFYK